MSSSLTTAAGTIAAVSSDEGDSSTLDQLSSLSLEDWLLAGGLIVGAIILATIGRALTQRAVGARADALVARLLGRLVAFAIFAVGFIYALNRVNVSVAPLLGILGLAGLALAFAFQDILENFIAGILMSLRRPITAGDQITTAGYSGTVEDINLRALELRTYEGERVFVPNGIVWKEPLLNHTTLGSRRTTLGVGVEYNADLDEATRVILEAVHRVEGVTSDPAPEAFVHNFGGSSIDIAVRFWHDPEIAVEWRVRDAVARQVKKALDAAGIGIPFPQHVIHYANQVADG